MAEVVLRPGTPADVPGIRSVGEAVVPPTYAPIDDAYARLMLDEWWSEQRLTTLMQTFPHVVAEIDGRIVGMANLGRVSAAPHRDMGHVEEDREVMWKLYVHPDHHGAGTGSRLLTAVEHLVEGPELWVEVVEGNDRAEAFYRARGFEEVERVADGLWPADIWFRKQLERSR
jgi:ribosomal protein S18 acetylase RimI-like enzyme